MLSHRDFANRYYRFEDVKDELKIKPFDMEIVVKEIGEAGEAAKQYAQEFEETKAKVKEMTGALKSRYDSRTVDVSELETLRRNKRTLADRKKFELDRKKKLIRIKKKIEEIEVLTGEPPYGFLISVLFDVIASSRFSSYTYDLGIRKRWASVEYTESVVLIPDEVEAICFKMMYEGEYDRVMDEHRRQQW